MIQAVCGVEVTPIPPTIRFSSWPGGDEGIHEPGGGRDGSVLPTSRGLGNGARHTNNV